MIVCGEVSACPTANGQCQIGNFWRVSRVGQHFWYQNIQVIAALGILATDLVQAGELQVRKTVVTKPYI